MNKNSLLQLYQLSPQTGLYNEDLSKETQVKQFVTYAKFLYKKLYDGPRATHLRNLSKQVTFTAQDNVKKFNRLCELIKYTKYTENSENDIVFIDLLNRFTEFSDMKNAGTAYNKYIKLKKTAEKTIDNKKMQSIVDDLKKFSDNEAEQIKAKIIDNERTKKTHFKLLADEALSEAENDKQFQEWTEAIELWADLKFNDLEKSYHDLDKETGILRCKNGLTLEAECTDVVRKYFSIVPNITIKRNVFISTTDSKTNKKIVSKSELDLIVINVDSNEIIGIVEVKSGVYDIGRAIDQLTAIKKFISNDHIFVDFSDVHQEFLLKSLDFSNVHQEILPKSVDFTNKYFTSNIKYLVITTIPQHSPVTGASHSDVQLVSSVLYNDKWFKSLVKSDSHIDTEQIDKIFNIIEDLRSRMVCKIDPVKAVELLGDSLLII